MSSLPLPPSGTPFFDPLTNGVTLPWANYLLAIQNAVAGTFAPIDARYWLSKSNIDLTDETNLGALASGYLKIAVAVGVATPSTTPTIPAADLSGTVPLAHGGTGAALAGAFASGTYVPTLTGVANVAASTAYTCQYCQIGTTVLVSGKVDIDPTAGATLTQLGISLPVLTNFITGENCGGSAAAPAVAGYSAAILADFVNDRAELDFTTAVDVANRSWYFIFAYQVL